MQQVHVGTGGTQLCVMFMSVFISAFLYFVRSVITVLNVSLNLHTVLLAFTFHSQCVAMAGVWAQRSNLHIALCEA